MNEIEESMEMITLKNIISHNEILKKDIITNNLSVLAEMNENDKLYVNSETRELKIDKSFMKWGWKEKSSEITYCTSLTIWCAINKKDNEEIKYNIQESLKGIEYLVNMYPEEEELKIVYDMIIKN